MDNSQRPAKLNLRLFKILASRIDPNTRREDKNLKDYETDNYFPPRYNLEPLESRVLSL